MHEDATQRPEDVSQVHKDVPHVSNATPEMTGAVDAVHIEGVATDGSLGSFARDEGFPCGLRDPSVLTGFAEHVAHSIWSGLNPVAAIMPSISGAGLPILSTFLPWETNFRLGSS